MVCSDVLTVPGRGSVCIQEKVLQGRKIEKEIQRSEPLGLRCILVVI